MAKTLLIGPSGSGKTHRLLDEFVQTLQALDNPIAENCFFVLPSAEHRERIISLAIQRGLDGFFYRRITTLSKLITEIFGIAPEGIASNVTRYLILRDLFSHSRWEYFDAVQHSSGFLNLMLGFIDELKESLISCVDFRKGMNRLKQLEPDLASKYEALASIYEAYEAELDKQGLQDRQDVIRIWRDLKAAGKLKQFKIQKIWLDGFFDFSNLQLEYLRDLADLSEDMTVTLTRDTDTRRAPLFDALLSTETFLKQIGFQIQKMAPLNHRTSVPSLVELEQKLFTSSQSTAKSEAGDSLAILEAIGMEGEMEMIAREILRLYRQGGWRFSDFAILLRQVGGYGDIIRTVFRRYHIPVEIHEREKLQFAPLMRAVVSLMSLFRDGWKRTDLMAFLKSSYVRWIGSLEQNYEWAGELEHWAYQSGVTGDREAWLGQGQGKACLEHSPAFFERKEACMKFLAEIEDDFRAAATPLVLKERILKAVQKDFGIFYMNDSSNEFVRRDAATLRRLEAILDEIGASCPQDMKLDFNDFADRFFRLAEVDLFSLHVPDKNLVHVYDVSLARQKEYRVVFAAGLLEKVFPVQIKEDPVLSDWERELLNSGLPETPLTLRLPRQSLERYLFYLAVTRAKEKLYLTYPRLDLEGKESLPSYYVAEVRSLYAGEIKVIKQDLSHPYPRLEEVLDPRELETAVLGDLWNPLLSPEEEPLLICLTNEILQEAGARSRFKSAFSEIQAKLTDERISGKDVFRSLNLSPTRLENYAKCPYAYFSEKVLELTNSEEDQNIKNRGQILHKVLEVFFEYRIHHKDKTQNMESIRPFIEKEFQKALAEFPLVYERRYQSELGLANLREMLDHFVEHELARLESSELQPRYFEFSFGLGPGTYPGFEIKDGDRKIILTGRIDRVDVDPTEKFGLILDYKSTAEFKKSNLEMGTALQLPLYLKVIEKYLKLKPVGGELYSIKMRKLSGFYHKENAMALNYISARKAAFSSEEFEQVLEQGMEYAKRFSREMGNRNIAVEPRDENHCESFCAYGPVCRIEKWRLPLMIEAIKEKESRG